MNLEKNPTQAETRIRDWPRSQLIHKKEQQPFEQTLHGKRILMYSIKKGGGDMTGLKSKITFFYLL